MDSSNSLEHLSLETQCTAFPFSRKLYDLGVVHKSYFVWARHRERIQIERNIFKAKEKHRIICPAYTSTELGLILPRKLSVNWSSGPCLMNGDDSYGWFCKSEHYDCIGDTEADARAKQLIFLLEYEYYKLPPLQ